MPMLSTAGRYLAEDRGAFDLEPAPTAEEAKSEPDEVKAATAPLYQVAAAHDGQPAELWLVMFYRMYGDLD